MIIATAPILATGAYADVSLRLTQDGVLIPGSEMINLWCEGDGARVFTLLGFISDLPEDNLFTFAVEWKQGEGGSNIATGGTFGNYNIIIQDIQN